MNPTLKKIRDWGIKVIIFMLLMPGAFIAIAGIASLIRSCVKG